MKTLEKQFEEFAGEVNVFHGTPDVAVAFAKKAINSVLNEAAANIDKNKSIQSISQCSNEVGLGAISQVYFRKGANWAKESILSQIIKDEPNTTLL